jgi:putative hemolysin
MLIMLVGCRTNATTPEPPGIANPASEFCEDNGGTVEIRTAADGGQYGVCMFDDGSECEEWSFMRGECEPGQYDTAPMPTSEP